MSRLANKVALITGAASGLGRAIALHYAAQGAKLVVCTDILLEADPKIESEGEITTADLICQKYGEGRAIFIKTDVTKAQEVEAAVKEAVERGGRLDVMVNNAGVFPPAALTHEVTDKDWHWTFDVNTHGTFHGCKYAAAQMLKQDEFVEGHRGWIVNVSSCGGLAGAKTMSAYCAAKGAVSNFTRCVALDYADKHIHCNALAAGHIKTAMTKENFENPEHLAMMKGHSPWWNDGNVDDFAKAAVFLASEDTDFVTGVNLPVDGGYLAT